MIGSDIGGLITPWEVGIFEKLITKVPFISKVMRLMFHQWKQSFHWVVWVVGVVERRSGIHSSKL